MFRTRTLFAGLLVAAAACNSSDTTTGATADDAVVTADVATVAADGVAEDVDVMTGMDGGIGNISASLQGSQNGADFMGPGGFHPGLTGCTFVGGSFNCPDTNRNGLSITRTITFLDASAASETGYDSLLTASIHILADISGDRAHGPWTATVDRHRDFTITGLAGPSGGAAGPDEHKPIGRVYLGLADGQHTEVKELNLAGNRERIRYWATQHALELIRRRFL